MLRKMRTHIFAELLDAGFTAGDLDWGLRGRKVRQKWQ